jgi:hypothetical protein
MLSEETNDKTVGSAIEDEHSSSGEPGTTQLRRKPRESKKPASKEPEAVFLLLSTADGSCELLTEDELATAGAKVINDTSFELFKAVRLSPKITFDDATPL